METAVFAGGCFWCLQHDFDVAEGVISTSAGYTGGNVKNPSYEEVCSGKTEHVEAIEVTYDPKKTSYAKLLQIYWHSVDPTRNDGQFCDIGPQYRPVIFYQNEEQKHLAEESKKELVQSKKYGPIKVDIEPAKTFYKAEEYHQQFYRKSPGHYSSYKAGSGREQRLKEVWGKKEF